MEVIMLLCAFSFWKGTFSGSRCMAELMKCYRVCAANNYWLSGLASEHVICGRNIASPG